MKQKTRTEYARRLEPVLQWLAEHPAEMPDLYQLADLACLSPYHFHRVYRAMMGETVTATMQRIRMHHAAVKLVRGEEPLDQVAQQAGYDSTAAFNRAFGARFGIPPGRYREGHSGTFAIQQEENMYPVTIEDFPGVTLGALEHKGDYHKIGFVFNHLYMLAYSRNLITDDSSGIGIYYDDPGAVDTDLLRSVAGIRVAPDAVLEVPLKRVEIPAMRCAVLEYTGPYNELEKAYSWLFGQWLPDSGCLPYDFPVFERYMNDPKTTPAAQLITRIYLPVQP